MGSACYNIGCQPCKIGSILACCYSTWCCECNFVIFPSPPSSYIKFKQQTFPSYIQYFKNSRGQNVPYLSLTTKNSQRNIIYFHGNAEDINNSIDFLQPFKEALNANIYAMQYPTYGTYEQPFPARISNKIKQDALQFYEYLKLTNKIKKNNENTIVIGRSIGSGGACYLASHKDIKQLILISPFSTIPQVAKDFVGCIGCIIKCHFNNLQQLQQYHGRLLVIHGNIDQVINVRHGQMVVKLFQKKHKCTFKKPYNMTHNNFDLQTDILQPIITFINEKNISS